MNYYTLSKKPTIELKSDAEGTTSVRCLDLLARQNKSVDLTNFDLCEVTEYYVGRPDLISYVYYGDDRYGDIICKINGISNPFELNLGDVIIVPAYFRLSDYIQNNLSDKANSLISTKEDSILETNQDTYKKLKTESRSPNELLVGQTNYVIDRSRGVIFY